jgi:DNA-binding response OmpR family regulator
MRVLIAEDDEYLARAVKTTIGRLRAKLGDPPVIQTIRDSGYRIGEP